MFRNISVILVSSALSFSAFAENKTNESGQQSKKFVMACSDEEPTIGLVVREMTDDSNVIIGEVFFFKGAQNAPLDMIPRASALDALKKRSALFASLPNYLRFEWSRSKCLNPQAFVTTCEGESDTIYYKDKVIKAMGLETLINLEIKANGVIQSVKANIALDINGEKINLPLAFKGTGCTSSNIY